MRRNADFTWAIVLALLITGIGTLRNERLCIRATGPSRQSVKAKSKNGTATANGRLNNEQTSYQGMIRSFQGTNDRLGLNALYNVIILVRSSFGPRSVLVRFSFGSRSVLVRFSFGPRSVLVRSSFGSRSVLVRSSFILRSSFVHPSFGIRSGFVRDSKNNQRSYEEATEMYLRHNGGIT